MISRRALLRTATAAAVSTAAGMMGGCGSSGRPLQVAVVWSGDERERFREVVNHYESSVDVLSVGDNIDAFLRARRRAGSSPDVAILPRPGLVTEYARAELLSSLGKEIANPFPQLRRDLLEFEGKLFGAWVKAAHKSLFWRLPPGDPFGTWDDPQNWDELKHTVRTLAKTDRTHVAPLAIGAADGWVLTDWFENVLAAISPPDVYRDLAKGKSAWSNHDAVHQALSHLGDLWGIRGAFSGGGQRALTTQFGESVIQVITGQAAMVFEGDFVATLAGSYRKQGGNKLTHFRFPDIEKDRTPKNRPLVVGGDAAVVFEGSHEGHDFVEWLTQPDTFTPWIRKGGYLSPHPSASVKEYPDARIRDLADELSTARDLRFDLSDQLPSGFTGADGVGIWRILQKFFAEVAIEGTGVRRAVCQTIEELDDAAKDAARQAQDGRGR
ncbi:MAG: extracellular solute-binding protein [Micromonosporaceae bacterium]|nr:extracellular solute-binding protein [Micromonosporaceae bacterium]